MQLVNLAPGTAVQPTASCGVHTYTLHQAFVFSGSLSIDAGILIRLDKEGFNGSQIASLSPPLFFSFFHYANVWSCVYLSSKSADLILENYDVHIYNIYIYGVFVYNDDDIDEKMVRSQI